MISIGRHVSVAQDTALLPAPMTLGTNGDLLKIWHLARRYWSWCLIGACAGLGLAAVYWLLKTPSYICQAQILVVKKDSRMLSQRESSSPDQTNMSEDLLSTHVQLISSPSVVGTALSTLDKRILQEIDGLKSSKETAVTYVVKLLRASKGGEGQQRDAHIISLSLAYPNSADGAAIVASIIANYRLFLQGTFEGVNKEAVNLISSASDKLGRDVTEQEIAYEQFRRNSPLLFSKTESANVHYTHLLDLENALSKVRIRRAEVQARLQVIDEALASPDWQTATDLERLALLDETNASRLNLVDGVHGGSSNSEVFQASQPGRTERARAEYGELMTLKARKQSLSFRLGPEHPEIQQINKSIRAIEQCLVAEGAGAPSEMRKQATATEMVNAFARLLRHDLRDLNNRERDLMALCEPARQAAAALVSYEMQDESMRNALSRKKELYLTIVDRIRDLDLMGLYGTYVVKVISPPEPGKKPSPALLMTLAVGGLIGLVFGSTGAAAACFFDSTFDSPQDVEAALSLPIIAHLPELTPRLPARRKLISVLLSRRKSEALLSQSLIVHEAFRRVRGAIFADGANGVGRLVQITAPCPGQGTTTLALHLAEAIARTGKRVLLLDCQFRRPSIDRRLNLDSGPGLTAVLAGECELSSAVRATAIDTMWTLPLGSEPDDPLSVLTSEAFGALLADLRYEYDLVLVDSPSLLAVTDPLVIGQRMDGILLTIEIGRNRSPEAIRAAAMLSIFGPRVLGVVVNCHRIDKHYHFTDFDLIREYSDARHGVPALGGSLLTRAIS
jgi:capsular exopolysaccharide synthesis family protein